MQDTLCSPPSPSFSNIHNKKLSQVSGFDMQDSLCSLYMLIPWYNIRRLIDILANGEGGTMQIWESADIIKSYASTPLVVT